MIYEEVINAEKRLDDCIDWETGEVSEDYDGNLASGKTKSFNDLETFEDFDNAIRNCKSEKAVNALWYKWKEKFAKDSDEYKKLAQTSSDMKLKLNNPECEVEVR